jgi:hypothetical protein
MFIHKLIPKHLQLPNSQLRIMHLSIAKLRMRKANPQVLRLGRSADSEKSQAEKFPKQHASEATPGR